MDILFFFLQFNRRIAHIKLNQHLQNKIIQNIQIKKVKALYNNKHNLFTAIQKSDFNCKCNIIHNIHKKMRKNQ